MKKLTTPLKTAVLILTGLIFVAISVIKFVAKLNAENKNNDSGDDYRWGDDICMDTYRHDTKGFGDKNPYYDE
mgnify:CR=1 FL=1